MVDVLLVSMPFGDAFTPSIALSLLQPQVRRRHLTCDILYLTLPFTELVGQDLYCSLIGSRHNALCDLTGEWIFSDALSDRSRDTEQEYVHDILIEGKAWAYKPPPLSRARIEAILRVKRRVPEFLESCLARVNEAAPRIIGFTSVFQQHVASLALAKRVKQCRPETLVVFGGANCEGVMGAETLRQYPFVDAVVSGEGDAAFPELVRRASEGQSWEDLQGVLTQQTVRAAFATGCFPNTPIVADLDALPHPDYSDYFAQFNRTRMARDWQPSIFVETSRGCWWGERMHCTFCGLNGGTMPFRSKSADRAYSELQALAAGHPNCDIQVVDNILDLKYFGTLLPRLAENKLKLNLFYETKSNLKKEQVRLLRDAGVESIQPGIESLSDQVLKLMRKGVSGLQNIQLLKWCKQFGLEPFWNLLFGFPGESPDEYHRMAELVPQLVHLPAPQSAGEIRLDRFSPNYWDAARLGFANVRPLAPYRFVYDVPDEALHNLAYYFAYDYQRPTDVDGYTRRLVSRVQEWRTRWRQYELLAIDDGRLIVVLDTRPRSKTPVTVLAGVDREVYLACDAIVDSDSIVKKVAEADSSTSPDTVAARLAPMVHRGILINDGRRYLSLPVLLGDYVPSGKAAARVLAMLSDMGHRSDGCVRVPLDTPECQLDWTASRRRRRSAARASGARRSRSKHVRIERSNVHIIDGCELRVRPR